jgi:hypothetical protein
VKRLERGSETTEESQRNDQRESGKRLERVRETTGENQGNDWRESAKQPDTGANTQMSQTLPSDFPMRVILVVLHDFMAQTVDGDS